MGDLISEKFNVQTVSQSYIFPPECRPGKLVVPSCNGIPVIDLGGELIGHNRAIIIQEIMKASQEFGFFQCDHGFKFVGMHLINHGVPENLMKGIMEVTKEFFEMPTEDKENYYSQNPHQTFGKDTSKDQGKEAVHFWREHLQHICHPDLENQMQYWPQKPTHYREVVRSYAEEVRKLSLQVLDLIAEGLGLEVEYFSNELGQAQILGLNYYPPCPDPSLTLGLPKHNDLNLITFLNQGNVMGLHVLKDEQWFAVEPVPNAFVINIGLSLQIISNGKVRSVDHRVVTNTTLTRITVASFLDPSHDSVVEPAKALVDEDRPPLYKAVMYKTFRSTFMEDVEGGREPLERYMVQS